MIEIVVQQFLIGIIVTIAIYALGKAILSFFDIKKGLFFKLFVQNIIGVFIILFCYSVFKSHGKTVFILTIPFFITLIYNYRQKIIKPSLCFKTSVRELIYFIAFFIILFSYHCYWYFDFHNNFFKPVHADSFVYAAFSDSLRLWGSENIFTTVNYFVPSFRNGIMPYHYPELWFTAVIAQVFNASSTTTLSIVSPSILISIYAIGVASLFEKFVSNKMILIVISSFLIGISGICFQWYNSFQNTDITWYSWVSLLGYSGIKFAFSYIFILLSFILLFGGEEFIGILILSLCPFFSVGLLPGIWGGILFYVLVKCAFYKFKNVSQYYYIIAFLAFEMILFVLFYYTFGIQTNDKTTVTHIISSLFPENKITLIALKSIVANCCIYFSRTMIFYIPFFLILLFNKAIKANIWILLLCIMLFGSITNTLLYSLFDSGQFSSNIGIVSVVLITFGVSVIASKEIKNAKTLLSLILLFILCFLSLRDSFKTKKRYVNDLGDKTFCMQSLNVLDRTSPILVFYNYIYFERSVSIRDVYKNFDDELLAMHQLSSIPLTIAIGNIDVYLKTRELDYVDLYYYNSFMPLNIWCNKSKNNNLQNFISHYSIKNFYFMNEVKIPDYIKNNTKSRIESSKTHNVFITIR